MKPDTILIRRSSSKFQGFKLDREMFIQRIQFWLDVMD